MALRTILVTGATGQQGGAVVRALLNHRNFDASSLKILALTRNASSPSAQRLVDSSKGIVQLIQGNSTNPNPIFDAQPKGSIDSLFVVTTMGKQPEEQQAIPLIDTAVEHGVKQVIFSSVDRGGDIKSWDNPCPEIPHFVAKHNIELHIRNKAEKDPSQFAWTILRPVAFMDNFNPGIFCKLFSAMWRSALKPTTKLQLTGVRDIGRFAAEAFYNSTEYDGKAVGIVGDELTLDEAHEKFKKVTGKALPETFTFLGTLMLWMVKEMGAMFAFFENQGYGVDIEATKKIVPTEDFETWLKESSKWK
ncbi:NmrA family protein [Neurospora intermedia]|uniref:NmrA family protein n=1 Tax=Neurospora intermedia TaxID=5142 RepID=A0ABR3D6T1_NEUIN